MDVNLQTEGVLRTKLFLLCIVLPTLSAYAKIIPNQLFCDHAVLQRNTIVPVWGTAEAGAQVAVSIAGQLHETVADVDGGWKVQLTAVPAGGPYALVISSRDETLVIDDILFGEVWLCSGQSNMEWRLRGNQTPMINAESEAAKATDGRFRYFKVPRHSAFAPEQTLEGSWIPSDPEAVFNFSGVSFFFGRYLLEALDVPIGIINSSWGGTTAESWTRAEALEPFEELTAALDRVKHLSQVEDVASLVAREFEKWYAFKDVGSQGEGLSIENLDTSDWEGMVLPGVWEEAGYPDFNGVVWFRKHFDLPSEIAGGDVLLRLGILDYFDTVWVNGIQVGSGKGNTHVRAYRIPRELLYFEGNVIAVRVLDANLVGGFVANESPLDVATMDGSVSLVNLRGVWKCRFTYQLQENERLPPDALDNPRAPSVLYNGMIAPLLPYAIRGVAWHQGESNARRAKRYRDIFPAMIADWREQWGIGDFPFLYVQIGPHIGQNPEIREAQLMTLSRSPNTAMVVTTDIGNAEDINPLNKGPVGQRLGLAAQALAYGEAIEYSGPIYSSWEVKGNRAVVTFDHTGGGLVAPGGPLRGFTMAGADGVFHPAEATIEENRVVVSAEAVGIPAAVRYGWANVPDVNLFNDSGLPASPFRTDVD